MSGSYTYLENRKRYQHQFTVEQKRYTVTGKTKQECDEKERQIRTDIDNHLSLDKKKITLNTYYHLWIEERKMIVKSATIYNYEKNWKNIVDYLGHMRIYDITSQHIKEYRNQLLNTKTITTVNNAVKLLRQILSSAVTDDIILKNPCTGIQSIKDRNKLNSNSTIHRPLNSNEIKTFLSKAKEINCFYYWLFVFLLNSGMRCSEALALTWKDIDFQNKRIYIDKTVSRVSSKGYQVEESAKTASGNRTIPLTPALEQALKYQKHLLINTHTINFEQRIFPNTRGKTANYNTVDVVIANIINQINSERKQRLKPFSSHAFRDTYATRCVEHGVSPNVLKELLGHSSIKVTMDVYVHMDDAQKMKEALMVNVI